MATKIIDSSQVIQAGSVTVTVRAQPLRVELDPMALAGGAAAALGAAIAAGIRGITQTVAPATRVFREKARKAFARGAPWALARYSATPGAGDAMFNDSGELAGDVQVDAGADGFEISLPGDRLQAAGGGDLTEQLAELVPVIDDPFSDDTVSDASDDAANTMITVG
jgi:hypothetical protein